MPKFSLYYRGKLTKNNETKREVRRFFHHQLKILAKDKGYEAYFKQNQKEYSKKEQEAKRSYLEKGFSFIPLLTKTMEVQVVLDILILRYFKLENHLLTPCSDIDNQIKVIFDALSCPQKDNQVNEKWKPYEDEKEGIYCLLENDIIVNSYSAEAGHLLLSEELEKIEQLKEPGEISFSKNPNLKSEEFQNQSVVIIKVDAKINNPLFDYVNF